MDGDTTDWDEIWREASLAARKWKNFFFHDDLVQVAAVALYNARDEKLALRRQIAKRRCIDEMRRWQGRKGLSEKYEQIQNTVHFDYEFDNGMTIGDLIGGDPDFSLRELVDHIKDVWEKPQQRVVAAGLLLGMKKEDIAAEMGVTPGRVSQLLKEMRRTPWVDTDA